jgi:hypothetical protein
LSNIGNTIHHVFDQFPLEMDMTVRDLEEGKPLAACAFTSEIPKSDDRSAPAAITPVPAQIMHSNAPRRSMPSFSSFAICFSSCRDRSGRMLRRPMGPVIYSWSFF